MSSSSFPLFLYKIPYPGLGRFSLLYFLYLKRPLLGIHSFLLKNTGFTPFFLGRVYCLINYSFKKNPHYLMYLPSLRQMGKRERSSKFHVGSKYRTLPANFHLFAPAILNLPPADGPVDEPAEMSRVEFPRRAVLTGLRRATSNLPAGAHFFIGPLFKGPQKEHLPLDVHRDSSPPLFEALNAPERRSQELRHFFLSFLKFLAERLELFGVHGFLLEKAPKKIYPG